MEQRQQQDFYVGRWHIQPASNEVTEGGTAIRLAPKFMQVLVCLAEHPGKVVTRETLLDTVWADTVVGEAVLTRAISELRKVFSDDAQDPQVIETILKTGYRLRAPVTREAPATLSAHPTFRPLSHRWGGVLVAGCLLLIVWLSVGEDGQSAPQELAVATPLTSMHGEEYDPALSPDGKRVAFVLEPRGRPDVWPDASQPPDLYIKDIDTDVLHRLTYDAATERSPAWSPDGKMLAFIRCTGAAASLFILHVESGPAQKQTDLSTTCEQASRLSWSLDGTALAYADQRATDNTRRIYRLTIASLQTQAVTKPASSYDSDSDPAFSPDGRWLAFARGGQTGRAVYVMPIAGGTPTARTGADYVLEGLDWTADGRSVVFASQGTLWQSPRTGGSPTLVTAAGQYGAQPTLARQQHRLAFVQATYDVNIWQMPLAEPAAEAIPLVVSTRIDGDPRIAPGGDRIAFISDRNGRCR